MWAFTFWILLAMLHWALGQIDSSAPGTCSPLRYRWALTQAKVALSAVGKTQSMSANVWMIMHVAAVKLNTKTYLRL